MKLHFDIWPTYQPLTEAELEDLADIEQTRFEQDADEIRKGES